MSETTHTGSGQKITTYYARKEKRDAALTGDTRKPGESRVEQNRRLRDESRAMVSDRPDSRENVEKESKRRKAAHQKIDEEAAIVRGRQYDEEMEEREVVRKSKKQQRQQPRETLPQHIGNRIPAAIGGMRGVPIWLNQGPARTPPWMRAGPGNLPPWFLGGSNPLVPRTQKSRGRARSPQANGGLPPWFQY